MTSTLENQNKTAEPPAAVGAMLEEEAEELGTASHEPSPAASEPRTGIPAA